MFSREECCNTNILPNKWLSIWESRSRSRSCMWPIFSWIFEKMASSPALGTFLVTFWSFRQVEKIEVETDGRIAEVSSLFAKVDDRRQKRDVPDFICGKISFEILKDPVITPSGEKSLRPDVTYLEIEGCLEKRKQFFQMALYPIFLFSFYSNNNTT